MKKTTYSKLYFIGLIYFLIPQTAYAYLDPGTGSLLFSAVLGIVSTIYFWGKSIAFKCIHYFSIFTGKKIVQTSNDAKIVFYSEGAQYWNTFKPVIDALVALQTPVTYWTSDEKDAGLNYIADGFSAQYIGKGNRAYSRLNMMEAKVCVSTTPGLDVLQIKRSKGVEHYAHIVHAPTTGTYKLYSFDYFDSIMCSGKHQVDAIRELEKKRGTHAKQLFETGCTYMDVLAEQSSINSEENNSKVEPTMATVLVAPSWGNNGLLTKFGAQPLKELLESGFHVILRPHPQSYIMESELLSNIKKDLMCYENLTWDSKPSGLESLVAADIMLSDFSGIVFDCAFVFEKPVITIEFDIDLKGLDANDLDHGLWELRMLNSLGKQIKNEELSNISEVINSVLSDSEIPDKMSALRNSSVYNYSAAGEVGAKQLLSLI